MKLLRFYPVYQEKKFTKKSRYVFSREWILLVASMLWGLLISMIALIIKKSNSEPVGRE